MGSMGNVRIRLNFKAMQVLFDELPPHELEAMHLMVLGKEMPDKITKQDLTVLIAFLCRKLDWIEEDETSCISHVSSAADISEEEHQLTEKMTDKSDYVSSTDDCMANQPEKEQDILLKTGEQIVKEENITSEEPQTIDFNKKDSLNNFPQITKDRVTKMTSSLKSKSHQKNITKRSGHVKKPFECEECGTTFFSKFSLQAWSLT